MEHETTQPEPDATALGLFAEASIALAANSDGTSLTTHAELLAALTHSDLVLLYEAGHAEDELQLVAQWGLPADVAAKFAVLGAEQSTGAGGLRALDADPAPLAYRPRTQDLEALGIRAYWGYPLWSDGELAGQLFFGSRRWDRFHKDVLSVFAATTLQIALALDRRRSAGSAVAPPRWTESSGQGAAARRQQFIAVLAHELRNPIAPIRSGIDLLATGLLDEEGRRGTTAMMQRQVAHLVRLIDDLLDTVRLNTGQLQVKREPALLRNVVRSAIESIRPALQARAQALHLDDEAAEVVIDADPVRLAQAFVNILSANVKQTPEGGLVKVSVAREAARLHVRFEDENPRAALAGADNVFELFPQSPMQSSADGLGIGLALVKGLVELNDGSVTVQRRPGGIGALYTVVLPVAAMEPAGLQQARAAPVRAMASHRLLIVDDNRDAADTLGLLFELDGHTALLAHDGPAAVQAAHDFQPEIILMDIGLPGFSGNEATRRIRAQPGPVRPLIVALTGWGTEADRQATRDAGCDLHLVKPISHERLRETIFRLLAERA